MYISEFFGSIHDHLRYSQIMMFGKRMPERTAQNKCVDLLRPAIEAGMAQHGYDVVWAKPWIKLKDSHEVRYSFQQYSQRTNLSSIGIFDFKAIDRKTKAEIPYRLQIDNSYLQHSISLCLKDSTIPTVYEWAGFLDVSIKLETNRNRLIHKIHEATIAQLSAAGSGLRPQPPHKLTYDIAPP